jgi:putative addiction module component (TIGR02574 family)
MTTTADQLLSALLQLTPEDRGEVAARLLESLELEADADAETMWAEEIRTRIEDVQSGRVKTVPWADARTQINDPARTVSPRRRGSCR